MSFVHISEPIAQVLQKIAKLYAENMVAADRLDAALKALKDMDAKNAQNQNRIDRSRTLASKRWRIRPQRSRRSDER